MGVVPYRSGDVQHFESAERVRLANAAAAEEAADPRAGIFVPLVTMGDSDDGTLPYFDTARPGFLVVPPSGNVDPQDIAPFGTATIPRAPSTMATQTATDLTHLIGLTQQGGSRGCSFVNTTVPLPVLLSAPHRSPSVSLLSSLQSFLMTGQGMDEAGAAACVAQALALPTDWDMGYVAMGKAGRTEATTVQVRELQAFTAVLLGAANVYGAGGKAGQATQPTVAVTQAMVQAIAASLASACNTGGTVNLAKQSTLQSLMSGGATSSGVHPDASVTAAAAGVAADVNAQAAAGAPAATLLSVVAGGLMKAVGAAHTAGDVPALGLAAADAADATGLASLAAALETRFGVQRTSLQPQPAPTLGPTPSPTPHHGVGGAGSLAKTKWGGMSAGGVIAILASITGAALLSFTVILFVRRRRGLSSSAASHHRPKGIAGAERRPYVYDTVAESMGVLNTAPRSDAVDLELGAEDVGSLQMHGGRGRARRVVPED